MEENKEIHNKQNNSNNLLNILLFVIIAIMVVSGAIIYYSLYKYSRQDDDNSVSTTNYVSRSTIPENTVKEQKEETTVADIISTAISESVENTIENEVQVPSGGTTVSTGDVDSRKVLNEAIIVLYDGLILEADSMGIKNLKYIDNSSSSKDDYVVTYYNYENYGYKNSSLGTLSSQVLDGLVKIDNVGKVAISEKYSAIPNEVQVVNSIPAVVLDSNSSFNEYDTKKTIICDLDGNGTNEYIVILANKTTGESKVFLVESTGFVKACIASMDKTGWDSIATDGYYLSYNNIEILDIDNDGIMEILFEVPTTNIVPSQISIVKYKNGDLAGTTDLNCSLIK